MRNLKRALSLALASVMLLGMMVVGSSAASYPDVDQTNHLEAIEVLQMLGIMEGDQNGNFNPKGEVTRYQMAALVCKLMGLTPGGNSPFTDFGSSDNWAKPYVAAVYNKGIMKGTGATTFDGSRSMTAAEAGMAMLKCLGYFLDDAELKDTSWKLATTREANKIDLYRGINYWSDQVMTRDNVAQMVLNTLESNVVVATPPALNVSVQTGGSNVDVTGSWSYPAAKNNFSQDYKNRTSDDDMQLCEKLFENDLKHLADTTDKMGRTATKWTYKNSSIESPVEPDKVYTKAVKGKDIFADLGKPTGLALIDDGDTPPNSEIYVDGARMNMTTANGLPNPAVNSTAFTVNGTCDKKIGGDGMIVEAYYNTTTNKLTLVVLQPEVGQIDQIDENDDGQRIVKIGSLEYVTNSFEEDDWVVYIQKDNESDNAEKIQSMYAIEPQTGTLTKTVGSNKYTIDGKEYTTAAYDADLESCDVSDEVDFYLDANGYIAKLKVSEGVVNVDNLAYVLEAGHDAGRDWASLRLADGTKKNVTTDHNYTTYDSNDLRNKVVSFKEDKNGNYKLTDRNTYSDDTKAIKFDKGQPTITVTSGSNVKTDSKTVFVCTNGTDVYTYTGYKNTPNIVVNGGAADDKIAAYCKGGLTKAATVVFIMMDGTGDTFSASNDMSFIVYDKDSKLVKEADGVEYYEYNAVVDGEITTVKVDPSKWATVAAETANSTVVTSKPDQNGIKPYLSLSKDADEIVNSVGVATAGTDYKNVSVGGTVDKVKNDTITLGSVYAYADDVKVFFVDKDLDIRAGKITEIRKDASVGSYDGTNWTAERYKQVLFTVESATDNTVTQIIIWEK